MIDHAAVFRDLVAHVGADLQLTETQARFWMDQGAARAAEALAAHELPPSDEASRRVVNLTVSIMLNVLQDEIDAPCPPEAVRGCLMAFWWLLPWHAATQPLATKGNRDE